MAESTQKIGLTHTNDEPLDSGRPLKKPRTNEEDMQDDDDEEPVRQTEGIKASDLYLDTASAVAFVKSLCDALTPQKINRAALDFDFEKVCSVSLSNINIYGCLVCGKYFQGRGKKSYAYAHSIHEDHHVFINLDTTKVTGYILIPFCRSHFLLGLCPPGWLPRRRSISRRHSLCTCTQIHIKLDCQLVVSCAFGEAFLRSSTSTLSLWVYRSQQHQEK